MDSFGSIGLVALILAVLVIGGFVGVLAHRANQRRLAALQDFVAGKGWTWLGDDDRWVDAWPVAPFGEGRGRRVRGCVAGEYRQVPFLSFSYEYYTESTTRHANGNTRTTRHWHRFDVAVLRIGAPIPDLHLSPEGAVSRLLDGLTGRDIDLESDAFNRAFRLHCADRKFGMDVFSPRTMEYVLAGSPTSCGRTGAASRASSRRACGERRGVFRARGPLARRTQPARPAPAARHRVTADVDVELRRRHDLVPRPVQVVRAAASHEHHLVALLTAERIPLSEPLAAVAERSPELRGADNFLALQRALAETEDRLAAARRIHAANVARYNERVQQVPTSLVARAGGFTPAAYADRG